MKNKFILLLHAGLSVSDTVGDFLLLKQFYETDRRVLMYLSLGIIAISSAAAFFAFFRHYNKTFRCLSIFALGQMHLALLPLIVVFNCGTSKFTRECVGLMEILSFYETVLETVPQLFLKLLLLLVLRDDEGDRALNIALVILSIVTAGWSLSNYDIDLLKKSERFKDANAFEVCLPGWAWRLSLTQFNWTYSHLQFVPSYFDNRKYF
jgi:hypothetical protein